jgi:hypothetical protein
VRVLVGLKALGKHATASLEHACQRALAHGAHRLRTIRQLLKRQASQEQQGDQLAAPIRSCDGHIPLIFFKRP